MGKITVSVEVIIEVDYYEKRTKLTDQQIARQVCVHVLEERNALAMEARIATIHLLDGESCCEADDEGEGACRERYLSLLEGEDK